MKYTYVLIRTFLGGSSANVVKLIVNTVPVYHYLVFRYVGMLILNYSMYRKTLVADLHTTLKDKSMVKSLFLSASLYAIGNVLYYMSITIMPVSLLTILDNAFHIIAVLILSLFFDRGIKRGCVFYIYFVLLFPSLYLVLFKDLTAELTAPLIGVVLLALNGVVSAIEVHITKRQLNNSKIEINVFIKTTTALVGALVFIPIFNEKFSDVLDNMTLILFLLLIYSIINSYMIKLLHTKSVKEIGAVQTSIFTILTPVFSIIIAVLLFGETLTFTQVIGILSLIFILYKLK